MQLPASLLVTQLRLKLESWEGDHRDAYLDTASLSSALATHIVELCADISRLYDVISQHVGSCFVEKGSDS